MGTSNNAGELSTYGQRVRYFDALRRKLEDGHWAKNLSYDEWLAVATAKRASELPEAVATRLRTGSYKIFRGR